MDFLNKAIAQLTDLFRSMTPGARITAGLLLTVVVVSVAYLFNNSMSGPDLLLLGGRSFTTSEQQQIAAAFGKAQLNNWDFEGSQIRIPRGQQDLYLAAMAKDNALPADFESYFDQVLESDNPFISDRRADERFRAAKLKRLGLIICSQFAGIDSAVVDVHEQKPHGMGRREQGTAMVSVRAMNRRSITGEEAHAFRQLVAAAFGMKPNQVVVTDAGNGVTMSSLDSDATGGIDDKYLAAKLKHEQNYRDKVLAALSRIPGVSVSAEATLSNEEKSSIENVKIEKNTIATAVEEQTSDSNSETGGPSGPPGLEANSPVPNGTQSVVGNSGQQQSTTESTSKTRSQFAAPYTVTTSELSGFTLKTVQMSVSVPQQYFADVWRQENPAPAGQEPAPPTPAEIDRIKMREEANIKKIVAGLLPKPIDGSSAEDLVTVVTFATLPEVELPAEGFFSIATGWLAQSWTTLAMFLLAGFALLTLRGLTRGIPVVEGASNAAGAALAVVSESADEGGAESGAKEPQPRVARLKRRGAGGPSLRDELSEIVREDPDAAANVLRSWIGNVT